MRQMQLDTKWSWISKRINQTWPSWVKAAKRLLNNKNYTSSLKSKRVRLCAGTSRDMFATTLKTVVHLLCIFSLINLLNTNDFSLSSMCYHAYSLLKSINIFNIECELCI